MGSRPTSLIVLVYVVIATDSTIAQKDCSQLLNMHIPIFCSYSVLSLRQLKLTLDTQTCQQDTPSFQFKGQLTAMDWGDSYMMKI